MVNGDARLSFPGGTRRPIRKGSTNLFRLNGFKFNAVIPPKLLHFQKYVYRFV
jgi:hypothetical protein